jgi:DNA-binding MarR family transcriptional regulator
MAEFRYRIREFTRFSERNAMEAGLQPQQHRMMLAIKGIPADRPPSIRNLAQRLQIAHHSAVELVDRAQREGLVTRRRDTTDRRMVRVEITPKGEKLLRQVLARNREELSSTAPALVRALRSLLRGNNHHNGRH